MTCPSHTIRREKALLRADAAARREAIAPAVRAEAARAIARIGIGFCDPAAGGIVSAYSAMGSEIDPLPLLARLAGEEYRTALPLVTPRGHPLTFRAWRPGEPLEPRTWGIMEPLATAGVVVPDILLVPLLSFDRMGYRLGYGGGYYDRTLEQLRARKRIVAISLAFAEQEVSHVPRADFDQRLDAVLLPDSVVTFD